MEGGRPTGLAGPPPPATPVPAALVHLAGDAPLQLVWANQLGGLTARIDHPDGARFAKWSPAGSPVSLDDERLRLEWLAQNPPTVAFPVPLGHGSDVDGEWLVTRGMSGRDAVSGPAHEPPELAASAMGEGLRLLHDSLDPADCPFDWGVPARLRAAAIAGAVVPTALHRPPSLDRAVVCHGDPCVPNTLLTPDGALAGIVDLGALGVADRWADLAVATWSLAWNFEGASPDGPVTGTPSELELVLLDAYGIAPDLERMRYYRALWAAG